MKKILCLCALALVFCSACRDKEANVLIFASDMEPQAYVQAGQRLLIRVRAYAEETTLSRVLISSIDAETGSRPVKDTSVGSTSSEFYFMY